MCNPRRVHVTLTQEIDEAWEQEICRTVELRDEVQGTARLRRPLDASLSPPVLRALEVSLADPNSGWRAIGDGSFRREVDGGYVAYHRSDSSLELVAAVSQEVTALGEERLTLSGRLAAQVKEDGEAIGYDDGYRGMDEEWARKRATEEAQRKTAAAARAQVEGAKRQAEAAASGEIASRAQAKAQETLDRKADTLRRELNEQARQQLAAVGALGRQEFHRALGQAYRRALLAYARTHQAEIVSDSDSGDTIEIELLVQR